MSTWIEAIYITIIYKRKDYIVISFRLSHSLFLLQNI